MAYSPFHYLDTDNFRSHRLQHGSSRGTYENWYPATRKGGKVPKISTTDALYYLFVHFYLYLVGTLGIEALIKYNSTSRKTPLLQLASFLTKLQSNDATLRTCLADETIMQ